MGKTRSDALLLNLPEERQAQIIEWCEEPKSEDCSGGYQFAREQLASDNIKVSLRALSEFYSAWHRKAFFEEAYQGAAEQKTLMLDFDPANVERAEAFGDFCFLQKAVKAQDPKTFVMLGNLRESRKTREQNANFNAKKLAQKDQQLAQKDRDHAFAVEKFQFDGAKAALAQLKELKQIAADRALSEPQKIQAVRLKLFGTPSKPLELPR